MTSAELQAILTTIHGHVDGKTGEIYSVSIRQKDGGGGVAAVTIDWTAFQDNFSGQSADRKGNLWSKTVGDITYHSKQENNTVVADTVPV